MTRTNPHEKVFLELSGSQAERGLDLGTLENFVDQFRRALRDFDRHRRAEQTRRGGHPRAREELVTAFRLVGFETGSAIMTLEPDTRPTAIEDQEELASVEALAIENLRAFMKAIEDEDEVVDDAVASAIEEARRALGADGKIEIKLGSRRRPSRRVAIDRDRVEQLRRRVKHEQTRQLRILGLLHMIDVEPDRVGIRAQDGVDWSCGYPPELEKTVTSLVNKRVTTRGVGRQISAGRGTLELEAIEPLAEFEQTPLFTVQQTPLADLLERQGLAAQHGPVSIMPDDVSDNELESFLDALNS